MHDSQLSEFPRITELLTFLRPGSPATGVPPGITWSSTAGRLGPTTSQAMGMQTLSALN